MSEFPPTLPRFRSYPFTAPMATLSTNLGTSSVTFPELVLDTTSGASRFIVMGESSNNPIPAFGYSTQPVFCSVDVLPLIATAATLDSYCGFGMGFSTSAVPLGLASSTEPFIQLRGRLGGTRTWILAYSIGNGVTVDTQVDLSLSGTLGPAAPGVQAPNLTVRARLGLLWIPSYSRTGAGVALNLIRAYLNGTEVYTTLLTAAQSPNWVAGTGGFNCFVYGNTAGTSQVSASFFDGLVQNLSTQ